MWKKNMRQNMPVVWSKGLRQKMFVVWKKAKDVSDKVVSSTRYVGDVELKHGENRLRIQYAVVEDKGAEEYMRDTSCVTIQKSGNFPFPGYSKPRKEEPSVPLFAMFGVFDGNVRKDVAAYCKKKMFALFVEEFSRRLMDDDGAIDDELSADEMELCLEYLYLGLDRMLYRKHVDSGFYSNKLLKTGSTATTVIVTPKSYIMAYIGNSRAILVRDGRIAFTTVDHNALVEEEKRRLDDSVTTKACGESLKDDYFNHELDVTRAFGNFCLKQEMSKRRSQRAVLSLPDTEIIDRNAKDQFLLIASKGLWSVRSNEQVLDFLLTEIMDKQVSVHECAKELVRRSIHEWGSTRNTTVTLLDLRETA